MCTALCVTFNCTGSCEFNIALKKEFIFILFTIIVIGVIASYHWHHQHAFGLQRRQLCRSNIAKPCINYNPTKPYLASRQTSLPVMVGTTQGRLLKQKWNTKCYAILFVNFAILFCGSLLKTVPCCSFVFWCILIMNRDSFTLS